MLSLGNMDDVADDDDVKKDPSVSSRSARSKLETQVYLEDLPTPCPPTRSKGKTPTKPSSSGTTVKSRSKSDAKKKALTDNCHLQVEVSMDPVSKVLTKSVSLSASSPKKSVSQKSDVKDGSATPPESGRTARSAPTTVEPLPVKTSRSSKASKPSKASTTTSSKPKGKAKSTGPLFFSSDEDIPVSPGIPPTPVSTASSDLAALLGDAAVQSSSPELDLEAPVSRLPESSGSTASAILVEPEEPSLRIMQPHLMEAHLITLGAYLDLPQLGFYRVIVPISFPLDNFDPPGYHSFDEITKLFRVDSLTYAPSFTCLVIVASLIDLYCSSLLEYFKWTSYGCYVNMGRIAPSILSLEGKTARIGDSPAVCMTVGLVTECNLFHPVTQSGFGGQGGKWVRRIRIMPLHQWFCRESTSWGLLFDLEYLETTCLLERGVSFPTRVEDQTGHGNMNSKYNGGGSNFSPAKRGQWRTPTKNLTSGTVAPGQGYPTSLGFRDEVPVYDGRSSAGNHFLFRASDFASLKSLPRFTSTCDLDAFSLVSVGYTLSVWSGYTNEPRVTPNVMFVIVLGSAPRKETLTAQGLLQ
ncbi:hypothetical protein EV421DRAFT_1848876 [Armillaria borealis]|uniref:Uncharacterized protein n=1 Tax=Armillaria borealis TaxID=47425 RepID=A0AA39IXQ5_9AGAR|nr:hypothetical protein EV421DRAFT_1848876 [Armillaria borealis]